MPDLGENLHISQAPIVNAGRIFKQTLSVARSGLFSSVIICGTARPGLPRQEKLTHGRRIDRVGAELGTRQSSVFGRIRTQVSWSMAVLKRYSASDIRVVNAHSIAVLPVCYLLSRRRSAKLIYDTHELETETAAAVGVQRMIFKVIERLLIGKCDAIFVVNESIADWYKARYPYLQPVIIRNIPSIAGAGQAADLRKLLSVPAGKLLFIHVGHLGEGRNIPAILDAFAAPAVDAHVVFLGDGQLEPLVREYCANHPNIHRLAPVSPADVVGCVAECDVGLCLTQLSCLSHNLSLPNKALEYARAGIPFFRTDLPEVARLLGPAFDSWRISDPARDLVSAITVLTPLAIETARTGLVTLRLPVWDEEAKAMLAAYASLLRCHKILT